MKRRHLRLIKKKAWRLVSNPIFPLLTVAGNLLIITGALTVFFLERGINPLHAIHRRLQKLPKFEENPKATMEILNGIEKQIRSMNARSR